MADKVFELSKSKYCKGIQCPKMLWMDINKPEEAEDNLPESVLTTGTRVGDLARSYFGPYALVNFDFDKTRMVSETEKYMRDGQNVIAEASFLADGLFCAVDILKKTASGYDIIEVKSSTHVSDIYVEDMAFQNYVLTKAGVKVDHVYNMHIDNSYVRQGDLDLQGLFMIEDYTDRAKAKFDEVERNIKDIRKYVNAEEEPEKDIDLCCENPYDCAYRAYCGGHLPEQSVFDIRRLTAARKYSYYHDGIVSFEDVVREKPRLSGPQILQVETAVFHKPDMIDRDGIRDFLEALTYPVYHLDFETYQQAVPEFDGIRPYAQIPFQYSLHIEERDGKIEHREFLAKEGTDPRRALAERLVQDIPDDMCVLAYNMSFERRVIKELAEQFEDLSGKLLAIRDNIHDLMIPFQQQLYYTEAMQGSYSIKYVLPALCPDVPALDYQNLEGVHNGSEAAAAFADMTSHSQEEIKKIRENLLKYCGLDTYAMVKVLEKLREAAGQ
ncbi:MAG: DUF2779 domain-containing protein [Lachnospiraceae bacterium]|nr:DUF2779 domain-containing protein [Lachnospiraceae bacterium]